MKPKNKPSTTTTLFSLYFFLTTLLLLLSSSPQRSTAAAAACGSCLFSAGSTAIAGGSSGALWQPKHNHHVVSSSSSTTIITKYNQGNNPILSALGFLLTQHFLVSNLKKYYLQMSFQEGALLQAKEQQQDENSEKEEATKDNTNTKDKSNKEEVDDPMSSSMVFAIGLYKNYISPLLPPACRFVPTCSQYGVQAIQEFGPSKGAILTAWRLLRCSPFGGRGYDPPKWPPVAYNYGSY